VTAENDFEAWARTRQACFELTPLTEMRGSERLQVGFNVDLYALLNMDTDRGEERGKVFLETWTKLKAILQAAIRDIETGARMEVEPMRLAAVMRQENKLQPEVNLRARVFHGDNYFAAVTLEERNQVPVLEEKIRMLGLRQGKW
jgi:hypothetical protein